MLSLCLCLCAPTLSAMFSQRHGHSDVHFEFRQNKMNVCYSNLTIQLLSVTQGPFANNVDKRSDCIERAV